MIRYWYRSHKLLAICADVCAGMMHLESKGLVHGHLTPTHILLDGNLNAKICSARGPCHPALLRYSAPESILSVSLNRKILVTRYVQNNFSFASDAWAFSVTSWEILDQCRQCPYEGFSNEEIVKNAERIVSGDPDAVSYLTQQNNFF